MFFGVNKCLENMSSTAIKPPIKKDNNKNPIIDDNHTCSDNDYILNCQFMGDYINSLPYSDRI